ncbi:hypothetical protein ACP70R_023232 [Stipagrostis hirtigluma subsp. patula]
MAERAAARWRRACCQDDVDVAEPVLPCSVRRRRPLLRTRTALKLLALYYCDFAEFSTMLSIDAASHCSSRSQS